jgi:glycosyltransferase involved in cell wall biosynthesis
MAHALETLLEAAERLATMPEGKDIRLLFLGDGARKEALVGLAAERGLGNVIFLDSVAKAEVPRYWSLLDVAVIHLRKTELFGLVIPSKLFECMGMGIPVLHGVMGESAAIVEREGVGLVFEPENADRLVEDLLRLRREPALYQRLRDNALRAAGQYDRRRLALDMLGVLSRTVEPMTHD